MSDREIIRRGLKGLAVFCVLYLGGLFLAYAALDYFGVKL